MLIESIFLYHLGGTLFSLWLLRFNWSSDEFMEACSLSRKNIPTMVVFYHANEFSQTSLKYCGIVLFNNPGVHFTTRCRALTAGLSLTLNLTTNSRIPVSQPLSCVSLLCANLSLSLTSQFSQWSSSIETTSLDHECYKQEAAGA